MIRTGLIVRKQRVVGLAIHHRIAGRCHKAPGRGGQLLLLEIYHPSGMTHHSITVSIGHAALGTLIPRLHNSLCRQTAEQFPALFAGEDIHTVRCLFRRFAERDAGMGVGHIENDAVHRDLRPHCLHLLPNGLQNTRERGDDVAGQKNDLVLTFSAIHTKRRYIKRTRIPLDTRIYI